MVRLNKSHRLPDLGFGADRLPLRKTSREARHEAEFSTIIRLKLTGTVQLSNNWSTGPYSSSPDRRDAWVNDKAGDACRLKYALCGAASLRALVVR